MYILHIVMLSDREQIEHYAEYPYNKEIIHIIYSDDSLIRTRLFPVDISG